MLNNGLSSLTKSTYTYVSVPILMLKAATDAIDLRPVRVAQKKGALLI